MTMTTASQPIDFDDVADLDESDHECMAEVARVLAAHGKLERFDLALAHGHFPLAADEILIETNDPVRRTLMVRPISTADLPSSVEVRETQWQFVDGIEASKRCRQACFVDLNDRHTTSHHYVG
jgi:hypothetical protein